LRCLFEVERPYYRWLSSLPSISYQVFEQTTKNRDFSNHIRLTRVYLNGITDVVVANDVVF